MSKDKEERKTLGEFTSDYADYDPEWYDDEGNYIGGTYVVPEFRIDEGSVAWQAQKAAEQHRQLAPTYTPSYADSIANILAEIGNRGKFSYDVNGDAIYHQYKDKYTQQGKLAMQDAMGQASAMTGGYGNSYAASVGNQAYQAQLGKLNDIIPELYNAAYSRYNQETQDMYNRYNLLNTRENELYSKFRDEYSDWQTEQNRLDSYASDLADDAWNEYVYTTNLGQDQFDKDRAFAYDRKEAGYKSGVDAYNAYIDQVNADEDKKMFENEMILNGYQIDENGNWYDPTVIADGADPIAAIKKQYGEKLKSFKTNVELASFIDSLDADEETKFALLEKYEIKPLNELSWGVVDYGGGNIGIDRNAVVRSENGDEMTLGELFKKLIPTMGRQQAREYVEKLQKDLGITK